MNKEEFKVNWAKWEGAQVDEWFDKMEALEKENEQLRAQLSQAQETIADFRSALEFYAKDFIDIDAEGNATRYKASAHGGDVAREVLARHPDSTEVKG